MADTDNPPVLADLMALKIDGPALVFVRPRNRLSQDEMRSVADGLKRLTNDAEFRKVARVKFVLVPADFDLMAIGDVELERAGLARLEPA